MRVLRAIGIYNNSNKMQEAEDRLLSLQQGVDLVPAYISKFERVLYEACGQNWPDINKISVFRNGLNSTIRGRLNQQLNLPTQYPAFVRIVQQLAGRSSSSIVHSQPTGNNQLRGPEPMDINAITINSIDTPSSRSSQSTSTSPCARSISLARREQYRADRHCVQCGLHKH